ncbi:MAG: HAMP domain-containing histidine kinase [Elusimicrobia bacterium]|nr:HAMP domain-containing histidine kinase [Elusimicrobiota bacterium]
MSIRLKLAVVLSLAMAAATAAAVSVCLVVQGRSLRAAQEEKVRVLIGSVQAMAGEAQLARDPLMLLDYLSFLGRVRPEVLGARARFRGRWREAPGFRPPPRDDAVRVEAVEVPALREFPAVGAELRFSRYRLDAHLRASRLLLTRKLLKGASALLLGALLASALLGWTLTSRLVAIERALDAIGAGRLDQGVPERGADEVASLARGINAMVGRLRELDEMKRAFVASVTHELKAPLFAIESYARLLLKDAKGLEAEERRHVERIGENAARLAHFVTSLLDLARIERGKLDYKPRPADLGRLVEDAVLFLRARAAEEGQSLTVSVEPGLPPFPVDADLIGQVITNLVSNAIKFTPRGGSIRVTLARRDGGAECAVEDTGVGVPADALGRLFQPFERVKNALKAPGTGLGLAIAKSIVEIHGGRIGVSSQPGRGSRFYFRLPAAA